VVAMFALIPASAGRRAAAAQDQPESVTVQFTTLNDSGVTGSATLTAQGNQTLVQLRVTGITGQHPDHIHRSTCANPEPQPTYPLTDVVLNPANNQGESETLVDVSLDELLTNPYLILIHKSKQEINVYVACADIKAATTSTGGTNMPVTGVGPTAPDAARRDIELVGLLALGAGFAVIAGSRLRRSPRS
jgi:hypothetical protein